MRSGNLFAGVWPEKSRSVRSFYGLVSELELTARDLFEAVAAELELVGADKAADDQRASDVSEQIDLFVKDEECRHHRDQRLEVEIVVGHYRAEIFHHFVPEQIGHYGAEHHEEEQVEHHLRLREVENHREMERLFLENQEWQGCDDAVEEQLAGD